MTRLGLVVALAVTGALPVPADDQPQWGRRHSRNMVSDEKGLPDSFDPKTGANVKWSVPLGSETHSSPVIAGGRVLIGTNNNRPRDPRHEGDRGVLLCLDEESGSLRWQLVVPKIEGGDPYLDWPKAGICSPPTVEGDRVYAMTNRCEAVCLDIHGMANGNDGPYRDEGKHMAIQGQPPVEPTKLDADILWLFDLRKQCGVYQNDATHCSILLHGRFLYINTSNGVDRTHRHNPAPDAPSLIVLDKETGRLVAQDDERIGGMVYHCTWSSPALGEVNGRPLVFFAGGDGVVYAFEPLQALPPEGQLAKLKRVWRFDCDPAAPKANIHKYKHNREVGPSNIKSMPVFHDGRVYVTVGGDIWWGKNKAWLKCIDASNTGDITQTGEVWSYSLRRHVCSTPAIHGGLVFVADVGRTVHCVDAATGKAHWTHETTRPIWGSTLVADGKVHVGTRRGELLVFAASKEQKLLSRIDLRSPISSTPVAANGVLYVATYSRLYALRRTP
ncbi:MAG: PQQ-binding-like beta-propeller repeat protein [Candidatus Brocadiae bacterium]|nr:PQQ-binding-like beta-propeller repeat protein [Candidatus Brocadiia bacterium]